MKLFMKIVKIWIKWNWCFGHASGDARHRGGRSTSLFLYQINNACFSAWIRS